MRKDQFEDLAVENVTPWVVVSVIWNRCELLEIASPDYLNEIKKKSNESLKRNFQYEQILITHAF